MSRNRIIDMSTDVYLYTSLRTNVYVKERDSRFSGIFVTMAFSLLVCIEGLKSQIIVRCYFPSSWRTILSTMFVSRPVYVLFGPRSTLRFFIPSRVFLLFWFLGSTTLIQLPFALGYLSRGIYRLTTLLNLVFYLFVIT